MNRGKGTALASSPATDWRRFAREAVRRLLERDGGPAAQLHPAVVALGDNALLHLAGCPDLRSEWLAVWSPGVDGTSLFDALLAARLPQPPPLAQPQLVSLVAWFASGEPVSVLTAGAAAIARGGQGETPG